MAVILSPLVGEKYKREAETQSISLSNISTSNISISNIYDISPPALSLHIICKTFDASPHLMLNIICM